MFFFFYIIKRCSWQVSPFCFSEWKLNPLQQWSFLCKLVIFCLHYTLTQGQKEVKNFVAVSGGQIFAANKQTGVDAISLQEEQWIRKPLREWRGRWGWWDSKNKRLKRETDSSCYQRQHQFLTKQLSEAQVQHKEGIYETEKNI